MGQTPSTWKRSAALLAAALLLPLLVACGGSAPAAEPTAAPAAEAPAAEPTAAPAEEPAAEPTAAPAEEPAAEPAAEKDSTLNILYWQAPTILNPHQASGTKDFDAASIILEPLARYSEKDEVTPYLAAEIPTVDNGGVAADGTSVTWKLKSGVKWSDGSDFTADDIIFTWQYCADETTACTTATAFANIDNIEAVDANTVKITWKSPTADPYQAFVGPNGHVLQKAQFGGCIGANAINEACAQANLAPIGTNAWKLKEFKPGDVVVYERNELYRDNANVYFDMVEMKGGGDAASAARAVCETGEYDYAWNLQVPKAALEPILAAGKCDPVSGGSFGIERIVVNFANPDPALGAKRSEPDQPHPFLTELPVRQAIAKAIDKKAIAEQLYGPTGVATCNILVAPSALVSPNTSCERDVEGAKKLLDDAGWVLDGGVRKKDGKTLKVYFTTSINSLRQGEQAIVKANLAEIGIAMDLKAVDASVFFSGDPANDDTLNKMYVDLQMYTNSNSSPDPTSYFEGWTCDAVNSSENRWQGGNDGRYCNPEYDATYAEAVKELDPAKRVELFVKLNDTLINDVAVIPLISRDTPQAKLKELNGPTYTNFDSVLWNIQTWSK
ncbi:MAG: peptide ABC transporter substrate-binding protein [Roseiflexaceae bacterium]